MKPIILTDEMRESVLGAIREMLFNECKSVDDLSGIDPSELVANDEDQSIELRFTPEAYSKMISLVCNFGSEVAWHGVVDRIDTGFQISDILVYPQKVTGATVNTDQAEYEKWLMDLDDNTFNRLRFQGHSHVNMGVTPSGVDITHQEGIIDRMKGDDFYIFLIMNKSFRFYYHIIDFANNAEYDTDDVVLTVGNEGQDLLEFLDKAEELVSSKYANTTGTNKTSGAGVKTYSNSASTKSPGYYNGYNGGYSGGYYGGFGVDDREY